MSAMKSTDLATGKREIYYPESDGKPMAETDLHWLETVELTWMLQIRYDDRPDVYVASDLLIYIEEGNPSAAVAPDVFVVFGVAKELRRVYKLWEEGVVPAVAIELTSRKTQVEDRRTKMAVYARLGVPEYFLYDPEADYLRPPLQGYRWFNGTYEPIAPGADGALRSESLGLDLRLIDGRLQLFDVASGVRLRRAKEREAALEVAEAAVTWERARAEQAEAELARLRAELARLQGRGSDA